MLILFTFRIKTGNWEKKFKNGKYKGKFFILFDIVTQKISYFSQFIEKSLKGLLLLRPIILTGWCNDSFGKYKPLVTFA